jgi:hypothetical protein
MRYRRNERQSNAWLGVLAGVAGLAVGLLVIRSLPDLVRYVKISRM